MKYVEVIKSFLLFFLVILSLSLTVMIWNYKPPHKTIDTANLEEISISERKKIESTLKPYRALAVEQGEFKGTLSNAYFESMYHYFAKHKATDLALVNTSLTDPQINELMRIDNRLTLFYGAQMPLRAFTTILPFENTELPEITFDRLIIDWNDLKEGRELTILFLNTKNKTLYRTSITNQIEATVEQIITEPIETFALYEEMQKEEGLSIYATTEPSESIKYMYYISDLSTEQFKSVLFEDPEIAQQTNNNTYTDSMSLLTIDPNNRVLNYVYFASEGLSDINPTKLLTESFQYVNDHGGFNGDYRLMNLNKSMHVIDYQLFYQGLPVFSLETTTKITTTWGDEQLYKYRRPFYTLEIEIPNEMTIVEMPSSKQVIERSLKNSEYTDVVLGYQLVQNLDLRVFELEPAWFYLTDSGWGRIKLDEQGGVPSGLE